MRKFKKIFNKNNSQIMLKKLILFINQKTGRRFWYEVKFKYSNKNKGLVFDWNAQIGFLDVAEILDHRSCKKTISPLHKINGVPKNLLKNGILSIEILCFLGWFSKIKKNNQ